MNSRTYRYPDDEDVILLPGVVYGPLRNQNMKIVFDPGAYRTILNTELIDALGFQPNSKNRRITTSSIIGKEYGYTLEVKFSILGFYFDNIEVAVFDLPEAYGIDGLLGLDIIERFEIHLSHRKREITLTLI